MSWRKINLPSALIFTSALPQGFEHHSRGQRGIIGPNAQGIVHGGSREIDVHGVNRFAAGLFIVVDAADTAFVDMGIVLQGMTVDPDIVPGIENSGFEQILHHNLSLQWHPGLQAATRGPNFIE